MKNDIEPFNKHILIEIVKENTKASTKSGIVLASTSSSQEVEGVIIAAANDVNDKLKVINSRIIFKPGLSSTKINTSITGNYSNEFLLIHEDSVLAIINKQPKEEDENIS